MLQGLLALPRTVWLIGLISLVNDSASEMIYPLVPLYLSSMLMAGPKALGLIEGVAEATSSLLKLVSGVIVDRTRRIKPWVVGGYALAGIGRPLIALATSWVGVLVIRFADRLGKGLRNSPRDALLARSITNNTRGLAFGVHRAMDNAGAVLGPLLAALFLGLGFTLREVFAIAIVPAVLCLLLTLALREPPAQAAEPPAAPFDWAVSTLAPSFRHYLLTLALFTLGNSSNMFLLLRARELGLPQAQVPLAWATVAVFAMLFSTPLSAWSDRIGRRRLIVGGWLAYGGFYLALGWLGPGSPLVVFGLFALYGVSIAATEGAEKALVADLTPPARLGTAYGWFNLVGGALLLPASLVFGWLYERAGAAAAFSFSAACALAASALLWLWVRMPVSAAR
ncbi:MAG TPA: MFS transporter [Albitalea sp.]|nr:MFS transporter [Albitalea sp.]